jgi:hypothetical protein
MWRPDPEWLEMVSQTTYETLRDQWMPPMPPVEFGAYLITILMELGPTVPAGMASGPITFDNVDAWCRRTGIDLEPYESRWLVRLSREWLGESQKASKHFAPAPWTPAENL